MRSQHKQIRDILDAAHYPVDPRHESEFNTMLLDDKKRRRRNLFWFCLCTLGILMAGYVLITLLQPQASPEKPLLQTHAHEATSLLSVPSQENASASSAQEDMLNSSGGVSTAISPATENSGTAQVPHSIERQSSPAQPAMHNVRSIRKDAIKETPAHTNVVFAPVLESRSDMTNSNSPTTPADDRNGDVWQDVRHTNEDIDEHRRIHFSHEALTTPLALLTHEEQAIGDDASIIPALRKMTAHRIHYGVSGAWFPAGQLLMKTTLKTGYGFQLGGYASYRMTPRIQLRTDAGFSRLDGGFTYIKESATQQYSFSVLHQTNTLAVEQLFSGYASTEIGVKRGKNIYCIGLFGQFLYGARGDIEIESALNEQIPTITSSEDVWLATRDMNRVSLHGSIGMRSRLTRRFELAAMVRIPITQMVRSPRETGAYTFEVTSHGISPQIMMSYQINQQ
ncbi:MAG TPA: hypothetical protein VI603_13850 [Saprospiraceae bacterium]|nr:hypothetical protein [Saprospiraceae bacterium]